MFVVKCCLHLLTCWCTSQLNDSYRSMTQRHFTCRYILCLSCRPPTASKYNYNFIIGRKLEWCRVCLPCLLCMYVCVCTCALRYKMHMGEKQRKQSELKFPGRYDCPNYSKSSIFAPSALWVTVEVSIKCKANGAPNLHWCAWLW